MNSNLLLELFFSLSKKEIKEFSKWIKSPFFNQREDLVLLFEYLTRLDDLADFEKKTAWKAVFPNKVPDLTLLRHSMSFLYGQMKDFIAYKKWQEQDELAHLHKISALRERSCDKGFQKEIKKQEKLFLTSQNYQAKTHFYKYLLQFEKYEWTINRVRTDKTELQDISNELSLFFICETLRLGSLMESAKSMSPNKTYDALFLEEVLEKIKSENLLEITEIAVYYNAFMALKYPAKTVYFKKLKELILTEWKYFEQSAIRSIYLFAVNYCIKKLNSGEAKFAKEALDLYKRGLEAKILMEGGRLSKFTYNNVLSLALIGGEFSWAKDYLEEYKYYLSPKERKNTYLYSLTNFYFKTEDYHAVLDLLQQVQFRDLLYNLNARRMLLCSYYELKEYKALDSVLDSFQVFLSRRNDLGYHKLNYSNLVKFVRKLLLIRHEKEELLLLKEKVQKTKSLAYKDWLLEKITLLST